MALKRLSQYFTTSLSVAGGINNSVTSGIILQDISGVDDVTKPGVFCITWSDPLDTEVAEFVTYTSINPSTKEVNGVTRGEEGYSAKEHLNGATVAFVYSKSHHNDLADAIEKEHNDDGTHADITADSITLAGTSAPAPTTQGLLEYDSDDDKLKYGDGTNTLVLVTDDYTGSTTTTASSATPTPTGNKAHNELYITALAEASELQVPSGTPTNGNKLIVRIKDNGTARALTYNAIYSGIVDTLPSTTTISKVLYMGFIYNSTSSKWEMVALTEES